ncbi:MAG: gliding motility lipoprotein GldH [Mangrovibacterium sp.]
MRYVIILTLTLGLFISCDSKRIFEEYKPVENQGWHKDSAIVFSVNLRDTFGRYNMYLNIRNRGDYSNRNIWLSITMRFPDGRLTTDTVELMLANPSGRWKGNGIGDLFDNQILYRQDVESPVGGEYQFLIRQAMRPVRLKGIQDVGIRLEKRR